MRVGFILYILLFLPFKVWAASEGTIPFSFVFFQVLNFSLFVGALFYLLRKKLPAFLRQKQKDFIDYREKAKNLEQEQKQSCLLLEKEIHHLREKQESLPQDVEKAVKALEAEEKRQEKKWLDNFEKQSFQELKRQEIKQWESLKTRLLEEVIQQTQTQLEDKKQKEAFREHLNHQIRQKWEGI